MKNPRKPGNVRKFDSYQGMSGIDQMSGQCQRKQTCQGNYLLQNSNLRLHQCLVYLPVTFCHLF